MVPGVDKKRLKISRNLFNKMIFYNHIEFNTHTLIKKVFTMATILIIDDAEDMRESLHALLEEMHYSVETAPNGNEALEIYKKNPVDLVITDLIMPEKDGVETIIELQKINPEVKVIAISGGGQISG